MLKVKTKLLIQKITVGIMLFAVLGFGAIRWLRFTQAPRKNVVVTYDSDLHDKSNTAKNSSINLPSSPNNIELEKISYGLSQADNFIKNGQDEQSLKVLNETEKEVFSITSNKTDPHQAIFQNIGNEIISVEQNLQKGKRIDAGRQIDLLLEKLNAENK